MNSIQQWYLHNVTEITWFIIGWLSLDLLHDLGQGNYIGVLIDAALIVLNYSLSKK